MKNILCLIPTCVLGLFFYLHSNGQDNRIFFDPLIQTFVKIKPDIENTFAGGDRWGDFDNDGDLDLIVTGMDDSFTRYALIYKNNGSDNFELLPTNIPGFSNTNGCNNVDWGDFNNDGLLDIILAGSSTSGTKCEIFKNNGTSFSNINAGLANCSSVAWGDFDNDGDLDVALTSPVSAIYRNDGNDNFSDIDAGLISLSYGNVAWGDYDNDGYMDLLITGLDESNDEIATIYRNNGDGSFTRKYHGLNGTSFLKGIWGDYDGDGDLDVLITKWDRFVEGGSSVFRNNGDDTFTETDIELPFLGSGSAAWGDYDIDGDLDLLMTGWNDDQIEYTHLYRNEGYDIFSFISDFTFTGLRYASAAWGDYDADGDLDFIISGKDVDFIAQTCIYRNDHIFSNSIPSSPTNLTYSDLGNGIYELQWDKAFDAETPQNGLSYNVYLYNDNGDTLISPMSLISTGKRKIVGYGNAQLNNFLKVEISEGGYYYWSVQAIDNNFEGSMFAPENSFFIVIPPPVSDFTADVTSGDVDLTVNFTDNSTGNVSGWSWDFGDIGTSAEQNPSHIYTEAGTYTVSLTVTGAGGSDTETKGDYITVTIPAPEADFSADVTSGDVDLTVNFTDISTGDVSGWSWDFGDDGTSTEQTPSHIYTEAGTYTVSLTVTGAGGSDMETKNDYISVTSPTGISGHNKCNGFTIFPNPANSTCILKFSSDYSGFVHIDFYSISGILMFKTGIKIISDNNEYELDVSEFPVGLYYVSVSSDSFNLIEKLIIAE